MYPPRSAAGSTRLWPCGLLLMLFPVVSPAGEEGTALVETSAYRLGVEWIEVPSEWGFYGGGVEADSETLYLITRLGALYRYDSATETFHALDTDPPFEPSGFFAHVESSRLRGRFGVKDIAVRPGGSGEFLVSHHYWHDDRDCYVMRLSALSSDDGAGWKTVFETEPCLDLALHEEFPGHQAGGRLAFLDTDTLLMTVGDHMLDGVTAAPIAPQDPDSSYGKVLQISLSDGTVEVFSSGHRNPQGLFVAPGGDIWSTEHGPEGGDELNLLTESANYGWPYRTLGTDYGADNWPLLLADDQGLYVPPVFAWIPSIGVSNLIQLSGAGFPKWSGDLLVASLRAGQLLRLDLLDGRVIVVEAIELGRRLRDLVQLQDGRIAVLADDGFIGFVGVDGVASAGDAAQRGKLAFAACQGCHPAEAGAKSGLGPNLWGVVGRGVAAMQYPYSQALQMRSDQLWTVETLAKFLSAPEAYAPGTAMRLAETLSEGEAAEIAAFLSTLR